MDRSIQRVWWTRHQVHQRTFGSKELQHPVVGELTADYETLSLPGDSEQTLYIYTTRPDSASRQAMNLLASWCQPSPGTRSPVS